MVQRASRDYGVRVLRHQSQESLASVDLLG